MTTYNKVCWMGPWNRDSKWTLIRLSQSSSTQLNPSSGRSYKSQKLGTGWDKVLLLFSKYSQSTHHEVISALVLRDKWLMTQAVHLRWEKYIKHSAHTALDATKTNYGPGWARRSRGMGNVQICTAWKASLLIRHWNIDPQMRPLATWGCGQECSPVTKGE